LEGKKDTNNRKSKYSFTLKTLSEAEVTEGNNGGLYNNVC